MRQRTRTLQPTRRNFHNLTAYGHNNKFGLWFKPMSFKQFNTAKYGLINGLLTLAGVAMAIYCVNQLLTTTF